MIFENYITVAHTVLMQQPIVIIFCASFSRYHLILLAYILSEIYTLEPLNNTGGFFTCKDQWEGLEAHQHSLS